MSVPSQLAIGGAVAAYSYLNGQQSAGASQFRATYETSPIQLLNGIAQSMPGGVMGLTALLPAQSGFAYFRPLPGASFLKYRAATYPMFNQVVAGNAMISEGIGVSIEMKCPSNAAFPYSQKQAAIASLVASLKQHISLGGIFSVQTPAYFYQNGLMTDFRDITGADLKQVQAEFQLDFFFPLITIADAQAAQGTFLQTLNSGAAISTPSWSTGTAPPLPGVPTSALMPPTIQ